MSIAVDFHMSVDWRWQRVKDLDSAKASPSRSRDDKWVQRAHKYQQRKATLSVQTEARITAAYPAIHVAHEIRMNSYSHFRWIIEAAVLANISREELAEYIALTPKVIEAYEKLFFDVRDKLQAEGYVAGSILGAIVATGVDGADPDGFWKMLAFNGGWEQVKGCWCAGRATPEAMHYYREVALQQIMLKAAASGLGIQPNSYNGVDLMRVGMERAQYEEEHGQGTIQDKHSDAFKSLVGSINVMVQNARGTFEAEEPRVPLPKAADTYGKKELPGD